MKCPPDSATPLTSVTWTLGKLLFAAGAYAACALTLHAQPKKGAAGVPDQQIVEQATLAASGPRVDVFQHGLTVDPAFLKLAEAAYERLEKLTGRSFDLATLGKVRIYVSSATGIAHVWKGYQHPTDPKGIVFLNPRVYAGALDNTLSTYVHEMAHLLTWRFHSHTLREGLATYLAQQVIPGSGSGLNPGAPNWSSPLPSEIFEYLGTTRAAPSWVTTEPEKRRAYYLAGYRFVAFLMSKASFDDFMKVYESKTPEAEMQSVYGASRAELVRIAMELRENPAAVRTEHVK